MQLDLPHHVIAPLRERVEAGEFDSLDTAVQVAIESYLRERRELETLRADLQQGVDSLDRGERRRVDSSFWEELQQHVEQKGRGSR